MQALILSDNDQHTNVGEPSILSKWATLERWCRAMAGGEGGGGVLGWCKNTCLFLHAETHEFGRLLKKGIFVSQKIITHFGILNRAFWIYDFEIKWHMFWNFLVRKCTFFYRNNCNWFHSPKHWIVLNSSPSSVHTPHWLHTPQSTLTPQCEEKLQIWTQAALF